MEIKLGNLKFADRLDPQILSFMPAEEIIELAKAGIAPHYILSNPLTKESKYLFSVPEIRHWVKNYCLKYVRGVDLPQPVQEPLVVFTFEGVRADPHDVPKELHKVREIYELPFPSMRTPPGIYFLCKEGKVQYVGQATMPVARVCTHLNEGKDFDTVYYIPCSVNRLGILEGAFIRALQPPLNTAGMSAPRDTDEELMASLCRASELVDDDEL